MLLGPGDVPHDHKYEHLLEAVTPRIPDEPEETDPVVLMYTGGTTGMPKGVVCDHRAEMLNVYHVLMRVLIDDTTVYLHQTPMFHAASIVAILAVPLGSQSVFMPMFDPVKVPLVIEKEKVTYTVMVPTMIGMMLAHPEFKPERLASLTRLTYGASPMPEALLQRLMTLFPALDLYQGYGMTESSSALTLLEPAEHRKGGAISCARPDARLPGVTLSIPGRAGPPSCPPGQTGEVCVRSGNYMQSYWKKPEETEAAFRGGWYHTGDAGYLDEQGYLFLVDRVKDMIVTGGENVYSTEVENAIASHPAVAQVAVIGIPHEVWGEAVHAIVVLRPGQSATEKDLVDHARQSIAAYKVPKSVEIRTQPLPLSGAMKVLESTRAPRAFLGRQDTSRELRASTSEARPRGTRAARRSRASRAPSRTRGPRRATASTDRAGGGRTASAPRSLRRWR